ncbi:DUF551 domain-containing protein [Klebsiella pneumoniae]|uniref:DUF551 domain-containing protein n=1 Tax=Klebsiella pneumoniae TaxID=573 RepID=UPI002963DAEE|nr:DUF551 domain-containing protein [Klebsiella pneumoniae]MDW1477193.1 DUF551 domain-containing protein [Klebsiella pneumoniae]
MTKSTITRERVRQIFLGNGPEPSASEERELARMALAAMDSEPLAVTDDELNTALQLHRLTVDGHSQLSDAFRAGFRYARRTTPQPAPVVSAELLHTAASAIEDLLTTKDRTGAYVWFDLPFRLRSAANAQPALVVPDEKDKTVDADDHPLLWSFNEGWNACRAAMLAAAPQSPGSEPATVPGKWIPVSERMPEVGDIVLTAMGGAVNVGEMECSAANCRFFTSVISGRELPATHWMPLPAGPKEDINALIPLVSRNEQEGK